jgi:hypothetical protein
MADYQAWLLEKLQDPDMAVAYLHAALEESRHGGEEARSLYLLALRQVAEAQGKSCPLVPNAETRRVIEEAERGGNIIQFNDLDSLFRHLEGNSGCWDRTNDQ